MLKLEQGLLDSIEKMCMSPNTYFERKSFPLGFIDGIGESSKRVYTLRHFNQIIDSQIDSLIDSLFVPFFMSLVYLAK